MLTIYYLLNWVIEQIKAGEVLQYKVLLSGSKREPEKFQVRK